MPPPPPPTPPDVAHAGRALPPRALPRGRRHGRGVGRHRRGARPPGRGEAAQAGAGVGPAPRRAVPARGRRRRPPLPPVDRRRLRHRARRRRRSRRDGARARARRCASASTPAGRLPVGLTIQIGIAIADALTAAHRARIVHRDIKPGNVLLDPEGRVLLTDFGIAKALQQTDDLTTDDVLMGTAKYLSPEQVLGLPVDSRADLYSLGVVLYECLDRPGAVRRRHATRPRPWPGCNATRCRCASCARACPAPSTTSSCELLSRDADDRPRNAALVRDALVRLLESGDDEDVDRRSCRATARPSPGSRCPASGRGRPERRPHLPGRPASPSARPAATSCRSSCCAPSPPSSPWPARCSSGPTPAPGWCARRATSSRGNPAPRPRLAATDDAATGRRRRQPASSTRRPAATAARTPSSSAPHRRRPRHGVVHRLLQRPQPGAEARRRPRVRAVGAGRRATRSSSRRPPPAAGAPTST